MKNQIQDGARITWTNGSGADVKSGDVVVIGNQIGVAAVDIAQNAVGEVAMEGVFECPATSADVIQQGTDPLWQASTKTFRTKGTTAAAGDVAGAATAWQASGAGATTVQVKLSAGVGTLT